MAIETAYMALFSCVDFVLHRYFAPPDQEERNVSKHVPIIPTYFSGGRQAEVHAQKVMNTERLRRSLKDGEEESPDPMVCVRRHNGSAKQGSYVFGEARTRRHRTTW